MAEQIDRENGRMQLALDKLKGKDNFACVNDVNGFIMTNYYHH